MGKNLQILYKFDSELFLECVQYKDSMNLLSTLLFHAAFSLTSMPTTRRWPKQQSSFRVSLGATMLRSDSKNLVMQQ